MVISNSFTLCGMQLEFNNNIKRYNNILNFYNQLNNVYNL